MRKKLAHTLFGAVLLAAANPASAVLVNFDDQGLTGPSLFSLATIPNDFTLFNVGGSGVDVSFAGGTILDNTANLPANQTALYGTADFVAGLLNPITITFSQNINNFFLDVYNGNIADNRFQVADNAGNSAVFSLPSNLNGGNTLVGFAATGTVVTITGLGPATVCCEWDFFIDNIRFDERLPPELAPEPATGMLLASGIALAWLSRRRRRAS